MCLQVDHHVMSVVSQERPRPEFAAMAPSMEQNPVTGVKEPYFPEKTRLSRMFTGSMVIVLMVGFICSFFLFWFLLLQKQHVCQLEEKLFLWDFGNWSFAGALQIKKKKEKKHSLTCSFDEEGGEDILKFT